MAGWIQYDDASKLLKYSTNSGASFSTLELDAAQIAAGTLADARIPSLNASKITAGTFDAARIPTLDAAKIGTGTLATARLGSGTADATTFLRGDQTWATAFNSALYAMLTLVDDQTYNDASSHTLSSYQDCAGLIKLTTSTGNITWIPFWANAGAGVAYTWTFLSPTAGWQINTNGSISFTPGGTPSNTYSLTFSSGSGTISIQRTAGTTQYNIKIYKFI